MRQFLLGVVVGVLLMVLVSARVVNHTFTPKPLPRVEGPAELTEAVQRGFLALDMWTYGDLARRYITKIVDYPESCWGSGEAFSDGTVALKLSTWQDAPASYVASVLVHETAHIMQDRVGYTPSPTWNGVWAEMQADAVQDYFTYVAGGWVLVRQPYQIPPDPPPCPATLDWPQRRSGH